MLRGSKVVLRARQATDVPILHAELYEDVETRSRADTRPWRPVPESSSPFAITEPSESVAVFTVVDLAGGEAAGGEVAGQTVLWGIDTHSRNAHIGLSLRPSFRGRGLGADVVRTMCRYGFSVLGLHRLQIETLADNEPMLRAATQAGFVREGLLRRAAWVGGDFIDEVVLGLLATEWPNDK